MSQKEFEYYQKLSPEDKRTFMRVKRANKFIDFGGEVGVVDPTNPDKVQRMPKTLPPEKEPDYIRQTDLTKLLLPKIEKDRDIANLSLRNIKQKSEFLRMLKNPDVQMSTGAYAELENEINKIKARITNDDELKEKITNTEFATARMGADVFALLKPLGIGARGLDTPAERKFLQKVLTGEITLERDTLIKMTEQAIKSNKKVVNDFYNRISSSKGNLYKDYFDQLGEDKEIYNLNIKQKYNLE
tara:strand:- start:3179 stop:3910 length:732 start_codon:yes stop_codon:yes gene_type:complete